MLYRKSSPNPPRLLLRIVATAGASALLGATACGSTVGTVPDAAADSGNDAQGPCDGGPCIVSMGVMPVPPDAGEAGTVGGGVVVSPDSGGDARGPCNGGPCGVVVMPHDAGEAGTVGGGIVVSPDSGSDAQGPCNGGPCGVVIHPEGGVD
jgi:hypothetical protein